MRKATSRTYMEAAMRIAESENNYCCFAIGRELNQLIAGKHSAPLFFELFQPKECDAEDGWWGDVNPENQNARVLALLLCAQICKD